MKINISYENNSLIDFYNKIREKIEVPFGENMKFDPSKIYVSREIFNKIKNYYEREINSDSTVFIMINYGPKTNEDLKENEVIVEDGFICKGDESNDCG